MARDCCKASSNTVVLSLRHCEKLLFNLDEMGQVTFLLDELGIDEMGLDEMGRHCRGGFRGGGA